MVVPIFQDSARNRSHKSEYDSRVSGGKAKSHERKQNLYYLSEFRTALPREPADFLQQYASEGRNFNMWSLLMSVYKTRHLIKITS